MDESSDKIQLLVVDDEPLNRDLLCRLLQFEYDLRVAGDAKEATEILEEENANIRLILCDHLMPGKTGAEFSELVRERWPDILFMLLTGYDGDSEVLRVLKEGIICDVIAKPWRTRELKKVISRRLIDGCTSEDMP